MHPQCFRAQALRWTELKRRQFQPGKGGVPSCEEEPEAETNNHWAALTEPHTAALGLRSCEKQANCSSARRSGSFTGQSCGCTYQRAYSGARHLCMKTFLNLALCRWTIHWYSPGTVPAAVQKPAHGEMGGPVLLDLFSNYRCGEGSDFLLFSPSKYSSLPPSLPPFRRHWLGVYSAPGVVQGH